MTSSVRASRQARLLSPGAVLCFHGATSVDFPSNSVANMPASQVIALIDFVSSMATVVPLAELIERRRSHRSLRGLVAVTFDDAYASLDSLLADYFRRRAMPITVFVATSYSRTGEPFWWDRMDDLYPLVSPDRWRQFESAVGLPDDYRSGQPADEGPLRPLRQWILRGHGGRTTPTLGDELGRLEREVSRATVQRPMTMDELESFCRRTGAAVAPHTMTHPVMPLLEPNEMAREISGSYNDLVERFGSQVVRAFAAPFGLYDGKVIASAEQAGICTVTLTNRTLAAYESPMVVPRLSMSTGITRFRLLAHVSGARERVHQLLGEPSRPAFPPLPGPTT